MTRLDAPLITAIVKATKLLLSEADVCRTLGIPPRTWRFWKKKGKDEADRLDKGRPPTRGHKTYLAFLAALKRARSAAIQESLEAIRIHGMRSWQAHAWLLERCEPEQFARDSFAVKLTKEMEILVDAVACLESRLASPSPGPPDRTAHHQAA